MKKKAEEDRLHYLSHFKKNREGRVKMINVRTSSSPCSFVTVNDLTTLMG
jgi:hypothetical protein